MPAVHVGVSARIICGGADLILDVCISRLYFINWFIQKRPILGSLWYNGLETELQVVARF